MKRRQAPGEATVLHQGSTPHPGRRAMRWCVPLALLLGLFWQGALGCQCAGSDPCTAEDCARTERCALGRCVPLDGRPREANTAGGEAVTADEPPSQPEPTTQETPVEPRPQDAGPVDTGAPEDAPDETPREAMVERRTGPDDTQESTPEGPTEPSAEAQKDSTGKPCKETSECPATEFCYQGQCRPPTSCQTDADCTAPHLKRCVSGACLTGQATCKVTGECLPGTVCRSGQCVPGAPPSTCQSNQDCPGGYACVKGKCEWRGTIQPTTCQSNSDCRSFEGCYFGRCIRSCTSSKDCTSISIPYCQAGFCLNPNLPTGTCNADSDCLPRQYCDPNNTCITCQAPPECATNTDCTNNESCVNGQCGIQCKSDIDCTAAASICSQTFCRGENHHPVGCPENQEICDLTITKVQCTGTRLEITVTNVGLGPAVGRFYMCLVSQGSKKGCNALTIMNYGSSGSSLPVQGTRVLTTSWKVKPGDTLHVDKPNLILEGDENNNAHPIQITCP